MNSFLSVFAKIFLAPIVKALFIKDVKGIENIPKSNFILASNHQSYFDIVVSNYVCVPRRYTFIGQVDKHKGFKRFLIDSIYLLGGVIPLNRKDEGSKKQSIIQAIERIKKGYSLVIYPEGARSKDGEIQKGKWGIAKIFLETGIPILPAGIKGARKILAAGSKKMKIKRCIEVNIGKPLYFKEEFEKAKNLLRDSKEYEDICIDITDKIMFEIKKLVYEPNSKNINC